MIASRSDPPLPVARLRANGQLVELRAADLRFTPEEAASLLAEVWKLDLSAKAVAALSLQGRADSEAFLAGFAGTHRYILDYLSEGEQPAANTSRNVSAMRLTMVDSS